MATIAHSALHFLDMWFLRESRFRAGLRSGISSQRAQAVANAAAYFGIARTLRTRHDVGIGLQRYEPVLALLESLPEVCDTSAVSAVTTFAAELSTQYGGTGTLSFSSKLLWLYYRDPVIIYDSQVLRALGTRAGDYSAYVDAWEARWQRHADDVHSICAELPHVFQFAECGDQVSTDEVAAASSEPWFHRRVVDVKLWYDGSQVPA